MTSDREQTVRDLIAACAGTDEVLAEPDLDLFEAGLLDSLGFVELLTRLDDEVGVAVAPTEIDRDEVSTVNKILELVRDRS